MSSVNGNRRSKRAVKKPKYLEEFFMDDKDICDDIESAQIMSQQAEKASTPKSALWPSSDEHGGARSRTIYPSGDLLNSLDESINALTIENKRLEREILMKRNMLLKSDSPKLSVTKSEKKSKSKVKDSKATCNKVENIPTLQELRASDKIAMKASTVTDKLLHNLDGSSSDTDSSSSDSSSSDPKSQNDTKSKGKDIPYVVFKHKQKRKAVSGEARAAKDRVKFDVPWPHEYAQTKSYNYQDKDFELVQLIRGEVSIIHNVEKSLTSVSRQKHLINLLYLVEKFPFSEIKDFHAEVLRSIERGQKSWSDNFAEEQARTLVSPIKAKNSTTKDKFVRNPICGTYQAGNCTQSGDHFGSYGDKKLLHVCRKCVRKGRDPTDSAVRHPAKDCKNGG